MTRTIHLNQPGTPLGEYNPRIAVPYPYHIEPDGAVMRQDFWHGDPAYLVGFQRDGDEQIVNLHTRDWFEGPMEAAVGMFPVFTGSDGGMYSMKLPVKKVTAWPPPSLREDPAPQMGP